MPYRHFLHSAAGTLIEGIILAAIAAVNGCKLIATVVSESDWQKITGPHAFLFGLIIAVIVLWNSARIREKNENNRRATEAEAREKHHAETLAIQKENSEKLMALTAESIKAHGMAIGAIKSIDRTIIALTDELSEHPCLLGATFKPTPPPDKDSHTHGS